MSITKLLALTLLLAPLGARADGLYKLDPAHSTLTYKVVHKLHEVEAKTHTMQGAAAVKPGEAQVQIRADVGSFDSDNANRDAHMKETVEAEKYPYVTLKGVLKNFTLPSKFPAEVKSTLSGDLNFHGVTNPIEIPVTLEFSDASHAEAKTAFDISLDAYKVERPSLLFVKLNDACHITVDVSFAK